MNILRTLFSLFTPPEHKAESGKKSNHLVPQRRKATSSMEWTSTKGKLVIIGGNEDKIKAKAVLQYVTATASAQCIAIIPTASTYGKELGNEYAEIFLEMGIPKAHVIAPRYVGEADTPEYLAMLQEADAFFFTGGDQVRLVEVFKGSQAFQIIAAKHAAGALVAGTSAGAAAVSDTMLFDGDDQGLRKDAVNITEGFGFLPFVTVDTHFLQRNRIPRLAQILAREVNRYAIGIDEDTALSVDSSGNALVIGSEFVTFMAASGVTSSNYQHLQRKDRFSIHGVSLSFLAAGARFHLPSWTMVE